MSNYRKHAMLEFKAAGWLDDENEFIDDTQRMICDHVLKLLEVFDEEGHSGSSAPYAINLFSKLAKFEPIVPLTGEDWEWAYIGKEMGGGRDYWQNIRCSHVFKDDAKFNGQAYDINAITWWEWQKRPLYEDEEGYPGERVYKSYYGGSGSAQPIEFPYTPKTEYKWKWSDAEPRTPPQTEEGFI